MKKPISIRETQVLHLIAHEYTSHQIADQLHISYHTAMSHWKIKRKKCSWFGQKSLRIESIVDTFSPDTNGDQGYQDTNDSSKLSVS
jgi:hypothetical protein